jgi:hypothetical protein
VPIIVRSSSLLEDNYGNSFSGKYESVFCANQGTPEERLKAFLNAVRRVYVSTINKEALTYRAQKGLLESEEQMALLVQRVSGDVYGELFFPQFAGVGYSFNPYVWNKDIDPHVGMLRLVFGLGTRAVDRHDDDYTRIVALNVPHKRPESSFDLVRKYAQQNVDVLNLARNQHLSVKFSQVIKYNQHLPLQLCASKDQGAEELAREKGLDSADSWVLTFEGLFSKTSFVECMREMLRILHQAYNNPVDVEFTVNFLGDSSFRINLLQCRPFQVKIEKDTVVETPTGIEEENILFRTNGPILGNSVVAPLDWIIYIIPSAYADLPQNKKYAVARLIGKLTHLEGRTPEKIMLLGPGRWGTTTPELGVPVSFAEINTVSVLCEIGIMHEGLVPDMSLGTHFYNDLVEMDLVYLGIMPNRKETLFNETLLKEAPSLFKELLPEKGKWSDVIRVIKAPDTKKNQRMYLYVDALKQEALCYVREV